MDITLDQVSEMESDSFVYVDIRGEIAYQHGHIDGTIQLEQLSHFLNKKDIKVIVYCTYGEKSKDVVDSLRIQGYDAYNLVGGFREWLLNQQGELSRDELVRYDRQIIHDIRGENINKAIYAKEKLESLNNYIKVNAYSEFLLPDNAENIISNYII